MTPTTDEDLQEMGKQLPHDRPDRSRTESVRASLLAAAAHPAVPSTRRWLLVGGGFAAGALAAAAVAIVVLRPGADSADDPVAHEAYARIESSSAAELEHTMVPTATGTDELVRVRTGKVRLAVPPTRTGDRVRVKTGDAEIEGSGAYEVVVTADALASVTVTSGTATLRLAGQQQAVFLAAGQTWRATVQTADLTPTPPAAVATADSAPPGASAGSLPIRPMADTTPPAIDPTSAPSANATANEASRPLETSLPGVTTPSVATPTMPRTPAQRTTPPRTQRTTDSGAPIETELSPERGEKVETPPDRAPRPAVTAPSENLATGEPTRPATPAVSPASETERHFRAGWSLLRANKLAESITELDAAARGEGPLAADARYYQAVALIRAKRGAEAERALVQFLDNAPASTRRGRAAIMLGRLITDRGDAAGAKAWFELAARDPDPTVAAAGKAALK